MVIFILSCYTSRCIYSHPRWLSGLMRSLVHSQMIACHCVLRNWDRILVRAVKGLISRAGIVSICLLLWQRDVKLQQTKHRDVYVCSVMMSYCPEIFVHRGSTYGPPAPLKYEKKYIFSSAVPSGSGAFQMPTRPSASASVSASASASASASTLRGGKGQSQKRFSNFFSFLAWGFFGMTLATYHKKDLVESL